MRKTIFLKGRSGIYGIVNSINNKIYIGKTKCMYKRCSQYEYDFKNRTLGHINDHLYNAMVKHGIESFDFIPLEFADVKLLTMLELEWIDRLESTDRNKGYNLRRDSSSSMIVHAETSSKISRNLKEQWSNGVRDDHSDKLKEYWDGNVIRKNQQSNLMSSVKTKYEYDVIHFNGSTEWGVNYSRLVELGLKNVISNFHRQKSDDVKCKGFRVIRRVKGGV